MMKLTASPKKHYEWRYFFVLLAVFAILVIAQNVSAKDREERNYRNDKQASVERKLKHKKANKHARTERHEHRNSHSDHDRHYRADSEPNYRNSYRTSYRNAYRSEHRHYRKHYRKMHKKYRRIVRNDYLSWRYPTNYRWIDYDDYYAPRVVFLRDHPRFGAVYFNSALGYCYGGWNRCVPVNHHHNRHCPRWHRHTYDFAWRDYGPEVVIAAPDFSIRFDWM